MKTHLRTTVLLVVAGLGAACAVAGQPLYENNFESAESGKAPEEFLVLNGNFAVKALGTNKVLELPGAPLDSYALQFGPATSTNVAVSARILGTTQGRRMPTFGVGLGGAGGWRLQVSPGKKAVELFKDQDLKASAAYDWKSGGWTHFRLQLRQVKENGWLVEGKVWTGGGTAPNERTLVADEPEQPTAGRASVAGSPFSGLPIWFDDLAVERVEAK